MKIDILHYKKLTEPNISVKYIFHIYIIITFLFILQRYKKILN